MAEVKWIKISTDIFNNRKIKQIRKLPEGDAIICVWVQILCLAGQINDNGMVYFARDVPFTEEMLATEFDRTINIIRLSLQTFVKFKMIEIVDNFLLVSNWEKYQSIDKLEKMKESNRLRQQKYREKQRLLIKGNVTDNVTVTESNARDIDIDKDIDKDIDINNKANKSPTKKFIPPSLSDVTAYCKERKNTVDPKSFIDHYTANGWFRGKTKIKDWKACVRTWERNTKQNKTDKPEWKLNVWEKEDFDE